MSWFPSHDPTAFELKNLIHKLVDGHVKWSVANPNPTYGLERLYLEDNVNIKNFVNEMKPAHFISDGGDVINNYFDTYDVAWPEMIKSQVTSGHFSTLGSKVASGVSVVSLGTLNDETDRGTQYMEKKWTSRPDPSLVKYARQVEFRPTVDVEKTFGDTKVGRALLTAFEAAEFAASIALPMTAYAAAAAAGGGWLLESAALNAASDQLFNTSTVIQTKLSAWREIVNGLASISPSTLVNGILEQATPRIFNHYTDTDSVGGVSFATDEALSWTLNLESESPPYVSGFTASVGPEFAESLSGRQRVMLYIDKIYRYTTETDWNGNSLISEIRG
jgi:hypothetical protein